MNVCTYIDGIASSQAIDTAGEIVDIKGLDCSSLLGAAFNYEHKSDVPAQIVGKVLEFKKIFSEKDCETDRQKMYWQKINMPFLYVLGRLFDDKKESSKEIAALFRDDAENPNEPKMVGFSIEGAKVSKEGMTITRSIARKVTITNMPANKTCVAEMVPAQKSSKNDPDSLFKGEIEFFNPNAKYLEFLQKREHDMSKDVGTGGGAFIGSQLATSELEKAAVPGSKYPSAAEAKGKAPALTVGPPKFGPINPNPAPKPALASTKPGVGAGTVAKAEMAKALPSWQHSGGGNFRHPEHGIVSVVKQPTGEFHVKHNGALAGVGGKKGVFGSAREAGAHAGEYMRGLSSKTTMGPQLHNRPSPQMVGKTEDSTANGEPLMKPYVSDAQRRWAHTPTGKKALGGEAAVHEWDEATKGKKLPERVSKSDKMNKALDAGSMMAAPSMLTGGAALGKESLDGKMKKSKWLARAEEAYKTWEKREAFEEFMQSRMPHLTKGEVQAIGQTLALKKAVEAEKNMSKMFSSYFRKGSDVMMAKEPKE